MKKNISHLLAAAALSAAVLSVTGALSVSAATVYTPRKTVTYRKENGQWVKSSESKSTYKKGKVTKYSYTSGDYSYTSTYSYKKGKTKSIKTKTKDNTSVTSYKWKNSRNCSYTIKTNGKVTSTGTHTYKNNLIVKSTSKASNYSTVTTYSYKGKKLVKEAYTQTTTDGRIYQDIYTYSDFDKQNNPKKQVHQFIAPSGLTDTYTTTYSYKYKGKAMTEKISTTTYEDGGTYAYKYVYSNHIKVKR